MILFVSFYCLIYQTFSRLIFFFQLELLVGIACVNIITINNKCLFLFMKSVAVLFALIMNFKLLNNNGIKRVAPYEAMDKNSVYIIKTSIRLTSLPLQLTIFIDQYLIIHCFFPSHAMHSTIFIVCLLSAYDLNTQTQNPT